jgi:uncharacterized sporulation protein YeaH/YhbH (DUF444 family)
MFFSKIDSDVERFRKIVKGKVRKDLKGFMSNGHMIGAQGGKKIKIPLPGITIPHFTFGNKDKGGTGSGDGEAGDPVSGNQKGPGKGKEGGDETSDHMVAEFTPDELAQLLADELQLPNIENKGKKSTETIKDRYSKIAKEGSTGLRHMKRTYKEALKRTMGDGSFDPLDPYVIPIKPDFRYKAPKVITIPEVSVKVYYLRDYSGSITTEMCNLIKSSVFWIDLWLKHQYHGKVESRYFVHDTVCEELDHDKFFEVADGGGTKVSPGYKKVFEAIQENPDENHYLFQWSDGDNQGGDWPACAEILNNNILPAVNLFGYGQVSEPHPGDLHTDLTGNIKDPKFVSAVTLTGDDILKTMKTFLGTGK